MKYLIDKYPADTVTEKKSFGFLCRFSIAESVLRTIKWMRKGQKIVVECVED